ncbi:hypothetical protein RHGRI_008685 [Rhododendron griersonianum]|uniref:Uncharacterized protein n=1 Tax=Rhododendron griersonianum TaxID=479676 RepID=A0AAV6L3F7_9ERIC|nr:hypothetical protein RHGRI_008685 [Rhododendron griersonianum]
MQLCKIKESHYYYCLELQDQQGLTPNLVTYSIPRANSIWCRDSSVIDVGNAWIGDTISGSVIKTGLVDMYAKRAEDGSMVNPRKVFDLIPASSVIYGLRLSQVVGRVEGIVKEVIELYFRIH